jgi:hypothetical protein
VSRQNQDAGKVIILSKLPGGMFRSPAIDAPSERRGKSPQATAI